MDSRTRRALAQTAAAQQGGVISRAALRAIGITKDHVRNEIAAERWRAHGTQTVAVHTRDLSLQERLWRAVWEVGERIAALDGVSGLIASGLTGFDERLIHVSIVHTARRPPVEGVRLHKVPRRHPTSSSGRAFAARGPPRLRCERRTGPCPIGRRPSSSP